MKYRKIPIEIDAVQLNSQNLMECIQFAYPEISVIDHETLNAIKRSRFLTIETLDGDQKVMFGDYILKDVKGKFHSVRAEVFELVYQKVE